MLAKEKLYHTLTARVLHWSNAAIIGLLIITGLYIRDPISFNLFTNMDTARKLHFICMYLILIVTFIRLYYSCINKDYRGVILRFRDIKQLPGVFKYYLFLSSKLPGKGRYNPGQRFLYNGWVLMILFQAATGFMLYSSENLVRYSPLLGGPVIVRQVHFLMTWAFIVTIAIHVYFAFLSGLSVVSSMFTGMLENKIESGETLSNSNFS